MSSGLIQQVISKFDGLQRKFRPYEIAGALHELDPDRQFTEIERRELDIEIAAWNLRPHRGENNKSRTHYHPLNLGTREDGSAILSPDLADLGDEAISQWANRLQTIANPFLRSRYADLLWDLAHIVQGAHKRDFESGQAAVDAYVEQACVANQISGIDAAEALVRAFQISLELNDAARTGLVVNEMLALGRRATLGAIGVWSMPAQCLLDGGRVAASHHSQLIVDLEQRLEEAALAVNGHACEVAARALCKKYRYQSDRINTRRVLLKLADTYEKQSEDADAGVAIAWLSTVVELLEGEGLAEEADRLRLIIERRGPEALASMQKVSFESTIDKQELDQSIDTMIAVRHPMLALFRLAHHLSPKCNSLRLQVKEHEESFVFYSLIPRTIIGRNGLPVATIGSSKDDMDGRMVEEAMHSFLVTPHIFHLGYIRARERFGLTPPDISEIVSSSYLCSPEISKSMAEGIQAYDAEDYPKAISILIPQVEALLRGLLTLLGTPTHKPVRRQSGFSELKNMNDVLSDRRVQEAMEEDLLFFLRVIFIDKRGWNLRNEFAHGALPADAFNRGTASIVMMALLKLAMIGPQGTHLISEANTEESECPEQSRQDRS